MASKLTARGSAGSTKPKGLLLTEYLRLSKVLCDRKSLRFVVYGYVCPLLGFSVQADTLKREQRTYLHPTNPLTNDPTYPLNCLTKTLVTII